MSTMTNPAAGGTTSAGSRRVDDGDATWGPGVLARLWHRPLGWHVATLAIVLCAVAWGTGPPALFSADEGLAVLQAKQLAEGGGWGTPTPFPSVDPQGFTFGVHPGPGDFVIYGKHPFFPVVLAPLYRLGGVWALVGLSILGTVMASWVAARVARRIAGRAERWVLWGVGVGSPLFFDSALVMAHSIGAALATTALLALLELHDRRARAVWVVVGVAATVATVLLRAEGVLFFGAFGVVFVIAGIVQRQRRTTVIGGGLLVAAFIGRVVDSLWSASVTTSGDGVADGGGNTVWRGLLGAPDTLIGPSLQGVHDLGSMFLLLSAFFVAVGAWQVRTRRRGTGLRISWILGVGCLVGSALIGRPVAVPGLLVACPVLLAGLVVTVGRPARPTERLVLTSLGVYTLLVLLTQYEIGGSAEWGARFLALGIPAALALVIPRIATVLDRFGRRDRRIVAGSLTALSIGIALIAVGALHRDHHAAQRSNRVIATFAASADPGDGGRPIVVTDNEYLWRLGWPIYDDLRWMVVDDASAERWIGKLGDAGVGQFVEVRRIGGELRMRVRETPGATRVGD